MVAINMQQVWECLISGIHYIPQTLLLVFVPYVAGFVLGLIVALIRLVRVPVLSQVLGVIITIMKGIPAYLFIIVADLLLTLFFDPFAQSIGWKLRVQNVNILVFAMIVLSVGFIPFFSEALRGALLSVPQGQYEAGYATGLTQSQIIRRIVLPQMIPTAMPQLTSLLIGVMKASALTYTIGVMDILNASVKPAVQGYNILEAYIAAGAIYWVLGVLLERGMHIIELRVRKFRAPVTA